MLSTEEIATGTEAEVLQNPDLPPKSNGWTRPEVPPLPLKVIVTAARWINANMMAFETAKVTREEANFAMSRYVGLEVSAEAFRELLDASGVKAYWLDPKPCPPIPNPDPMAGGGPLLALAAAVQKLEADTEANKQVIAHNARKLADFIDAVKDLQRKLDIQGNAITKLARQQPSGDRTH